MTTCGYEDWDFWVSMAALGYKWVTVKDLLAIIEKWADSC